MLVELRRRIGPVLLVLLTVSTLYGWVRWSGMPDFAWGCDLFGHLNQSKQIRLAWREQRAPNFIFESPQTHDLIGFMKSTGRPAGEWLFMVGPHAHHFIERADQVADQYSPATGLLLSFFPEGRSISWLIRVSLLVLLAFGANAVVLRAIMPSTPRKAPGALVAAMWPALAVFQAIRVLARSELWNPAMYAVVLPTFLAAFFCALAWSRENGERDSRLAAFASGALAGFAAFIHIPAALQIPGLLVLLKRRDWPWFLAGGYFFGLLPLAFYQAHAAGAWWATTYGPLDPVAPSLRGSETGYFLLSLLTFASYFALRGWKHWRRLGIAALVSWTLPALYLLTREPAISLMPVGLLGWAIFFEYEEAMPEFKIGSEVLTQGQAIAFRFAPAALIFLSVIPLAWALVSFSNMTLEPPLDASLLKHDLIPEELLRKDSWIWSDGANGAFWYYGDKPAFNIASGGSPELRKRVFTWVALKGADQFLIKDGDGSERVAKELEASGAKLDPRGEVFGKAYYKISLGRIMSASLENAAVSRRRK